MNVFVNNQSLNLDAGAGLATALEKHGVQSQRGIAVAVNNQVIPRAEWNTKQLSEDDKITIIKATQGG